MIDPQGKAVTPEAMHRDGDVDMHQESPQLDRVGGIVKPRRQVDPQVGRMQDSVVGGPGLLGGPAGNVLGAPVL